MCIPLLSLTLGCDPSIFQPPKSPNKNANGAPTWKASTLNLQCFDHTTAAQLFHHQLAFHVAFSGGGWVVSASPCLSWPWEGWHSRIWHWFIDTRDVSPFKDGGKTFSVSGITYFVIENFNFPPKKVGKFRTFSRAYVRAYQPNQTNKQLASEHDDWKTILSFWNGPFMGHLNIPFSKDTLVNIHRACRNQQKIIWTICS